VMLGIPTVYGSIHRFEGQLSVFGARDGPCYRCLFREPPPAGAVPNCAEAGVLGVLPGVIGTLQASETIKLLTGIGEPLVGRLLLFDALTMSFRTIALRPDADCPSCGVNRSASLVDYEQSCGVSEERITSIAPYELAEILEKGEPVDLVDVREEYEWNIARIPGARLVPLSRLADEVRSFDSKRKTILYCKTGVRSMRAAEQLVTAGFENVGNLTGGIVRWREEIDPSIPLY